MRPEDRHGECPAAPKGRGAVPRGNLLGPDFEVGTNLQAGEPRPSHVSVSCHSSMSLVHVAQLPTMSTVAVTGDGLAEDSIWGRVEVAPGTPREHVSHSAHGGS